MNITQILLGSTAAMLLAALILSYGAMKGGEAEDGRKHSATELLQENVRLQAEVTRLRTGQPAPSAVPLHSSQRGQPSNVAGRVRTASGLPDHEAPSDARQIGAGSRVNFDHIIGFNK